MGIPGRVEPYSTDDGVKMKLSGLIVKCKGSNFGAWIKVSPAKVLDFSVPLIDQLLITSVNIELKKGSAVNRIRLLIATK